jgi:transposase
VGSGPRRAGEHHDHVSDHPPGRLDLQKKTLGASERDAVARDAFRAQIATLDPDQVIAVDETASTIALTRRYARAPQEQRAYGSVPKNYGISTTVVTALTAGGFGPAVTIDGAMNTAAFHIFVRDSLAPTLRGGQVVVLDNLSAHKTAAVIALIEQRGCTVLYLPPYSPDFNPIELAFAKLKAFLRHAAARTQDTLDTAIRAGLDIVTPDDACAFFQHCGYRCWLHHHENCFKAVCVIVNLRVDCGHECLLARPSGADCARGGGRNTQDRRRASFFRVPVGRQILRAAAPNDRIP